jgi:hypothetical protein
MCVVYDIWLHQIFIFTGIVIVRDHCNVGLPLSAFLNFRIKSIAGESDAYFVCPEERRSD